MEDKPTQVHWTRMDKGQQGKVASFLAQIDGFRAVLLTLVAATLAAQPLWQAYYKNQDSARALESVKAEKQSESAMVLAKAAISEVTILSSKYGELKVENESLKDKLEVLTKDYADLSEKYRIMELAYTDALAEKKKLEERIDSLFLKHKIQEDGEKLENP